RSPSTTIYEATTATSPPKYHKKPAKSPTYRRDTTPDVKIDLRTRNGEYEARADKDSDGVGEDMLVSTTRNLDSIDPDLTTFTTWTESVSSNSSAAARKNTIGITVTAASQQTRCGGITSSIIGDNHETDAADNTSQQLLLPASKSPMPPPTTPSPPQPTLTTTSKPTQTSTSPTTPMGDALGNPLERVSIKGRKATPQLGQDAPTDYQLPASPRPPPLTVPARGHPPPRQSAMHHLLGRTAPSAAARLPWQKFRRGAEETTEAQAARANAQEHGRRR
ncbi:hypothetical protein V500_10602, partial [Pseudogymnoascus sp. VKM F-4518 (FW-2643)]